MCCISSWSLCALTFHLDVLVICYQYAKNIIYSVISLGMLPVSEETSGSVDRGRRWWMAEYSGGAACCRPRKSTNQLTERKLWERITAKNTRNSVSTWQWYYKKTLFLLDTCRCYDSQLMDQKLGTGVCFKIKFRTSTGLTPWQSWIFSGLFTQFH